MRLAILPEFGDWSASTRYRALQHVAQLQRLCSTVDVLLPDDRPERRPGRVGQARFFADHGVRYVRRWSQLHRELGGYDVLLVQRALYPMGPDWLARPVERFAGRVVLDLDDAVFEEKPSMIGRGAPTRWLYGPQQTQRVLARADAVVVSTEVLRESLAGTGVPSEVLPTIADPRPYAQAPHRPDRSPRIAWAGTVGGLPYLDPLAGVMADLQADGTGGLTVISSAPWDGPSEFRRWTLADEHTAFADYDIGIMPLPDTPYTRGKAGFKLLQYMAAGLPVVASPVGVNRRLVLDSGAGLLADSPAEWHEALTRLLRDRDLRREMGARGRRFVEDYCDLDRQAEALVRVLEAPAG